MFIQPTRGERNFETMLFFMEENMRACHHKIFSPNNINTNEVQESIAGSSIENSKIQKEEPLGSPSTNFDKDKEFEKMVECIMENDTLQTEDLIEIVRLVIPKQDQWIDDDYVASLSISPVIIAITYGWRAHNARERQNAELAWSYLGDCCYWTGVAISGKGLADVMRLERKQLATKGALAKNRQYSKIKEYAYQLVHERCPKDKGWPSVKSAAASIEEDLSKYNPDGEEQVKPVEFKTILNWLSKMPARTDVFPKLKNRVKKKPPL